MERGTLNTTQMSFAMMTSHCKEYRDTCLGFQNFASTWWIRVWSFRNLLRKFGGGCEDGSFSHFCFKNRRIENPPSSFPLNLVRVSKNGNSQWLTVVPDLTKKMYYVPKNWKISDPNPSLFVAGQLRLRRERNVDPRPLAVWNANKMTSPRGNAHYPLRSGRLSFVRCGRCPFVFQNYL